MFSRLAKSSVVLAAFLFANIGANAQTVLGSVSGTVWDSSGAVVAKAQIAVRNLDTGTERKTQSSDNGSYSIPNLAPGPYSLNVSMAGFQNYLVPELRLQVNEFRTADITLTLGDVTQTIETTAEPPPINTTDATIGTVIQNKEIVQLPLNGRHFTQLILLAPGSAPVQQSQQQAFTVSLGAGGVSPAVNGMRPMMNNFTLDGVENNSRVFFTFSTAPPPDAIQEFKVQGHQSDAQASFSAGANINLVTRAGTNRYHGSAWEFLRNDKLAAKNFFDNFFGRPKLPYRQNQYGFTLGGPVVIPKITDGRKNRTFFFGYYEGFKSRRSNTYTATVPETEVRRGDFSRFLGAQERSAANGGEVYARQIFDPLSTTVCSSCASGYIRTPFAGNIIPTSRVHPLATAWTSLVYPDPNRSTYPNLVLTQTRLQDSNQYGVRADHEFTDNVRLYGRFSRFLIDQYDPGSLPVNANLLTNQGLNSVLHYTQVISPAFLLDAQFGYNRTRLPYRTTPFGEDLVKTLGPNLSLPVPGGYLPPDQVASGSPYTRSFFNQAEFGGNPVYQHQYNVDLKRIMSGHEFSFGGKIMRWRNSSGAQGNAQMYYESRTTNQPGTITSGDPFASFLLGFPVTSSNNYSAPNGFYGTFYVGYAQDAWKVTRKLTVTLGLQYAYSAPGRERNDRISVFDYATALQRPEATDLSFAYIWGGTNPITGAPSNAKYPSVLYPDRNDFAPRVALAYSVTSRTVIRTGFGIFYDYGTSTVQNTTSMIGAYPYALGQQTSGQNEVLIGPLNPPISLDRPFVAPSAAPPVPNNTVDYRNRSPYVMQWNFGFEHLLPAQMVLSANYVGSGGRKLDIRSQENMAPAGLGPIGPRRPLPNAGSFFLASNQGIANYHALQTKVEKRFSRGLTFRNSYTWSKSLDIQSDPVGVDIEYAYNRRRSYGPSDYDIPHTNVLSWVYDLPVGKGRHFAAGSNGVINAIAGGWQLSGIFTLRNGNRYFIRSQQDTGNTGNMLAFVSARADVISDPTPAGFVQRREAWFDRKAFAIPAFGTLGNHSRNALVGPTRKNFDFTLSKDFVIRESLGIEFRTEFFNAFNRVNFGTPRFNYSDPNFGEITGASAGRDIQFALKLHF